MSNKPLHSISNPVDIRVQEGPRCSAYAASCLMRYEGKEAEPIALYNSFWKLPDGSALPRSVGRKSGHSLRCNGSIEDIEKMIDNDKPVMVLIHYSLAEMDFDSLHYVLVTGYDEDHVYIADSLWSGGAQPYNRIISREDFVRLWDVSDILLMRLFYGKNLYYS